jgi:NMD protein affecting ribosome stability and mRNA decay
MPLSQIHARTMDEQIAGARCPRCGKMADGATGINDTSDIRMPKEGDVAICIHCGAFNIYLGDRMQREMTSEELEEFARDPRMADLMEFASRISIAWRKQNAGKGA